MTKKPLKARKNNSKSRSSKPKPVALVRTSSFVRHFKLVSHAHTGKMIHHRHSSHGVLILLLLFVGMFIVLSHQVTNAQSGTVSVGAVVNGPPPSVGADITSPLDQTVIDDQTIITVSGTCAPGSFVVVQSNSVLAGSTNCSVAGIFTLTVDLSLGQNVLTALNYDNVNQPGPVTPAVTITLRQTDPEPQPEPEVPPVVVPEAPSEEVPTPEVEPSQPQPTLPENPSIIPGLPGVSEDECESYDPDVKATAGGEPSVSVVCIPRILEKDKEYTLGVVVSGGEPPYALNIDWGVDSDTLISIPQSGYNTVKFRYMASGVFNIKLNLTDKKGSVARVETGVQVSGENREIFAAITDILSPTNWFEVPIPLYLTAVAVTLGFWGGDIFDRYFGAVRRHPVRRKKAS